MLSATETPAQTTKPTVHDLYEQEFPTDDEQDANYELQEQVDEEDEEDEGKQVVANEEEEEEEEDDVSDDEVKDIVMESLSLQDAKSLRSGKYIQDYRDSPMMEFDSEEDEEYMQGQEEEEEESDDESDDEEEVESDDELQHIVTGVEHVAADTLLKPNKVLRHGKELPSEDMEAVTAKIQQLMQPSILEKEV